MPSIKKLALHTTFYLLLTTILSGCTAIGTNLPAALQITTTPEASIFLDGKHIGKTPFHSEQLQAKQYTVKLTTGEATYTEKVDLKSGTLTVINRELNNNYLAQSGETLYLESGQKGLFIVSMPDGAEIALDDQKVGKTPQKIEDIANGDHKITLSKQGYIDREFAVKTSNQYQLVADVTLASEIAKGSQKAPTATPQPQMVVIQSTPQGFLRVRKEASATSAEVGRVKTGDKLEVSSETTDWIKVKFESKEGWISSQYTKKLLP